MRGIQTRREGSDDMQVPPCGAAWRRQRFVLVDAARAPIRGCVSEAETVVYRFLIQAGRAPHGVPRVRRD